MLDVLVACIGAGFKLKRGAMSAQLLGGGGCSHTKNANPNPSLGIIIVETQQQPSNIRIDIQVE